MTETPQNYSHSGCKSNYPIDLDSFLSHNKPAAQHITKNSGRLNSASVVHTSSPSQIVYSYPDPLDRHIHRFDAKFTENFIYWGLRRKLHSLDKAEDKADNFLQKLKSASLIPVSLVGDYTSLQCVVRKVCSLIGTFECVFTLFGERVGGLLIRENLKNLETLHTALLPNFRALSNKNLHDLLNVCVLWNKHSRILQDYQSEIISCCYDPVDDQKTRLSQLWINFIETAAAFQRIKKECVSKEIFQTLLNDRDLIPSEVLKGLQPFSSVELFKQIELEYHKGVLLKLSLFEVCGKRSSLEKRRIFLNPHNRNDYLASIQKKIGELSVKFIDSRWLEIKLLLKTKNRLQPSVEDLKTCLQLIITGSLARSSLKDRLTPLQFQDQGSPKHVKKPELLLAGHPVFAIRNPTSVPIANPKKFCAVIKTDLWKAGIESFLYELSLHLHLGGMMVPSSLTNVDGRTIGVQPYIPNITFDQLNKQGQHAVQQFYDSLDMSVFTGVGFTSVVFGDRDLHTKNLFVGKNFCQIFDLNLCMPTSNDIVRENGEIRIPYRSILMAFPHADKPIEGGLRKEIHDKVTHWINNDLDRFYKYLKTPMGQQRASLINNDGLLDKRLVTLQERLFSIWDYLNTTNVLTFRKLVHHVFPNYQVMEEIESLRNPKANNIYHASMVGFRSFNEAYVDLIQNFSGPNQYGVQKYVLNMLAKRVLSLDEILKLINVARHDKRLSQELINELLYAATDCVLPSQTKTFIEALIFHFIDLPEQITNVMKKLFSMRRITTKEYFHYCRQLSK